MKFIGYLVFACAILFSASLDAQKRVPDLTLKDLNGKTVQLKDYVGKGKPVVLSFFATWCKPCITELDNIAEVYGDWQKKYQVEILAITIDTQRQLGKVKPLAEVHNWEYQILSDVNSTAMQLLGFQTIPQSYLLDGSGNIVYGHSGYSPGDEIELEEQLKKLAKK